MKKVFFYLLYTIAIYLIAISNLQAQNPNNYNLLWRIEGNGLQSPSYLFGTMHVKNAKAFNFSDSVMLAIEQCKNFALELHPDTMVNAMFTQTFNKTKDSSDTKNIVKELLTKEEYSLLKEQFEKKNGYDFEQIKVKNPAMLHSFLTPDLAELDDKATFVDAHLLGVAKTLKKNILGLEKIEDQFGAFEDSPTSHQKDAILDLLNFKKEDYIQQFNQMIEYYHKGNLEDMERLMGPYTFSNPIMVQRNNVMAQSLDLAMQQKSTFAAIGAAHLIGENSVIALLQAKGYTVSPVQATFTGVWEKYKIDLLQMSWVSFGDTTLGYTLEMPNKPFPINLDKQLNLLLYPDLSTGTYYGIFAIDMRASTNTLDEDVLFKRLAENYKKSMNAKILKKKRFNKNGMAASEILLKNDLGIYIKLQFLIRNNIFYGLLMGGTTSEISTAQSNRFFNSFQNTPLPPVQSKEWSLFEDKQGAFSILLPKEPKIQKQEVPNPIEEGGEPFLVYTYIASDYEKLTNYIFAYYDFPPGYYLDSPEEAFTGFVDDLSTRATILSTADTIWLDGTEGREVFVSFKDAFYSKCRVYIRGNRIYKIFKQNLNKGQQTLVEDDFFNSFAFSSYQDAELHDFTPEQEPFQIKEFEKTRIEIDSTIDHEDYVGFTKTYYSTNPNSGGVYSFEYSKLSEYFKVKHIDSFYNYIEEYLVSYSDSLITSDSISINGIYGKDILIKNKWNKTLSRTRFWVDKSYLYIYTGYLGKDELFSTTTNTYFEGYQKNEFLDTFDIYASKTKKIIDNLHSQDTFVYAKALGALTYYEFDTVDTPLLLETIQTPFDDDSLSTGARSLLILSLASLQNKSTIPTLVKLYKDPTTTTAIKSSILSNLLYFENKEGLPIFLDLFLEKPINDFENLWSFFAPFKDSLALASTHFEQLIPFLEKSEYKEHILSLAVRLASSENIEYQELIKQHFDVLIATAFQDLEDYKIIIQEENSYHYSSEVSNYLELMKLIKNQSITDKFTKELTKIAIANYLKKDATVVRIFNHLKVDKKVLKTLYKDDYNRFDLIKAYFDVNEFHKVPKKYHAPSELAKLHLAENLYYDDSYPDEINLLGTLIDNDSTIYVYRCVYTYEKEKEEYIGLAGSFAPNAKSIDLHKIKAYSPWTTLEEDWKKQAAALLPDFKNYAY